MMILNSLFEFTKLLFDFMDNLVNASKKIVAGVTRRKIVFVSGGYEQVHLGRICFFEIDSDMDRSETIKNTI